MPKGKFKIALIVDTVDELIASVKVERVVDITHQPEEEEKENDA